MPFLGDCAVRHMGAVLDAFEDELFPALDRKRTRMPVVPEGARRSTMNINSIHGGQTEDFRPGLPSPNVPDSCRLTIDRRFLLEEDIAEVKGEVTAILDRLKRERPKFDYEIRDVMEVLPLMTERDAPVAAAIARGIREVFGREPDYVISPGTYDQKHVSRIGHLHDCIAYGPGILDLAHRPDEWVGIADMVESAKVMAIGLDVLLRGAWLAFVSPFMFGRRDAFRAAPLDTEQIQSSSRRRHRQLRLLVDRLEHHAIAFGELHQRIDPLLRLVRLEFEGQADRPEADRRILGDAQRAAEVEVAFGRNGRAVELELQRGRHGLQRHAGAGDQRFEQHVAGAKLHSRAAGRRMQAGDRDGASGLDLAGDRLVVDRAARAERDQRLFRRLAIGILAAAPAAPSVLRHPSGTSSSQAICTMLDHRRACRTRAATSCTRDDTHAASGNWNALPPQPRPAQQT